MRWLHLSDIHFNPDQDGRSSKQLRKKLSQYIKRLGIAVDEVFVTGDYRHAGKQHDSEEVARSSVEFLKEIAESAGVSNCAHIHIIPGNHDLKRIVNPIELEAIRNNYDYDSGIFKEKDITRLIGQFDFFRYVNKYLHAKETIWPDTLLPLHTYRCFDDYNLLYMNTAITCGSDDERGKLVIGNNDLYEALEGIQAKNPDTPIIVLAHHAIENFHKHEREAVETIFRDYAVKLYLCGDSHEIWYRQINGMTEITMGCIKQEKGVQAVFSVGEMTGNTFSINAHEWDARLSEWGLYTQYNQQLATQLSCFYTTRAKLTLAKEWFQQQNTIQIKNLGNRYMPDVHVPLDIYEIILGISRSDNFKKKFLKYADEALISINKLKEKELSELSQELHREIISISFEDCEKDIPINNILDIVRRAINILSEKQEKLSRGKETDREKRYYIIRALDPICAFEDYLSSEEVSGANRPYMLIYGDGGIGKSHMLASIVNERMKNAEASVFLLGQHFSEIKDPLLSIPGYLHLDCMIDELLEQLNQVGMQQGSRVIIFIDALNEGAGKSIWIEYLSGVIESSKKYPWIGLVMTIRSQYLHLLFDDNKHLEENLIQVEHHGFSTIEYAAVLRYFDFYNVKLPIVPIVAPEFENPLFLRLFCEGYNANLRLNSISLTTIYENYIRHVNRKIADRCGFNSIINVVQKVIEKLIIIKYSEGRRHFADLDVCLAAIAEVAQKYNIQADLVGALLSEGVLTQNTLYDGSEYLYITYEKMDNYGYAELLADEFNSTNAQEFAEKHSNLTRYQDILQALAIVMPEKCGYEIFEIYADKKEDMFLMEAFIYSLQWRTSASITDKTGEYINTIIFRYVRTYEMLIDVLISLSPKIGHPFNVYRTHAFFNSMEMPSRDAALVPVFDKHSNNEYSSINKIIDWALFDHSGRIIDSETIKATSIILAWFLLSPTNKLRDRSTKAIINLLSGDVKILIELLNEFREIDDPYILERLYGVALGCAVEMNNDDLASLSTFVCNEIFNVDKVYPNILLRDYAKNIIDYAMYKLKTIEIDYSKVKPPYKSDFPQIPSDEDTKKYNTNDPGAGHIWSSMKVEYSRDGQPGGYGDFGRYTFQSYFSAWRKQLNPMDLKNIALKRIYEMGYDPEIHGEYDSKAQWDRYGRSGHERIGKKYQWIALYELAAQVSDNFLMEHPNNWSNRDKKIVCTGSFEPNIRNIDPTIKLTALENEDQHPKHKALYTIPNISHDEWVSNFNDIPDISDLLHRGANQKTFILLEGYFEWYGDKELGRERFTCPQKRLSIQIGSYICKKSDWSRFYKVLKNLNLAEERLPEARSNHVLYNKEYYWSEAYSFYKDPYYGDIGWTNLVLNNEKTVGKVLIPVLGYASERSSDLISGSHISWYKPCEELFEGLNLSYGKDDSILYNQNGDIVCFDTKELFNEDIGFLIDEKLIISFLDKMGWTLFWIVRSEKQIIHDIHMGDINVRYKRPDASGIYYYDDAGIIQGKLNMFE